MQNDGAVRKHRRFVYVVRDEHDRLPPFQPEFGNEFEQRLFEREIERRERLVHEQDLVRVQECPRDRHALAFAPRKRLRVRLFPAFQSYAGKHSADISPPLFGQDEAQIFFRSEVGQQARRLEEIGIRSPALHGSFVRSQSRKHIQKRRLARAALAEHGGDRSVLQRERNIRERGALPIAFGHVFEFHLRHLTIRR